DALPILVHAHQLLQHLRDPVQALVELARVCRNGGVIAVRDADYAAMSWYPAMPGLTRWRELYRAVAARNGGHPDPGRQLLAWAHEAGCQDVTSSAGVAWHSGPEHREWWSGTGATRVQESSLAGHLLEAELATPEDLAALAQAWQHGGRHEDGSFAVVHGEILIRM